jgi:hypothetical protein
VCEPADPQRWCIVGEWARRGATLGFEWDFLESACKVGGEIVGGEMAGVGRKGAGVTDSRFPGCLWRVYRHTIHSNVGVGLVQVNLSVSMPGQLFDAHRLVTDSLSPTVAELARYCTYTNYGQSLWVSHNFAGNPNVLGGTYK